MLNSSVFNLSSVLSVEHDVIAQEPQKFLEMRTLLFSDPIRPLSEPVYPNISLFLANQPPPR